MLSKFYFVATPAPVVPDGSYFLPSSSNSCNPPGG